jgi:phage-related minor tail protein
MADKQDQDSKAVVEQAPVDRVLAVSRHPDGSPAQSPGFKSVDPEATAALSEAQLREMAASAVDHAHRSAAVAAEEGSSEPDAETKKLKDAQEKAADAAAKKVEKLED